VEIDRPRDRIAREALDPAGGIARKNRERLVAIALARSSVVSEGRAIASGCSVSAHCRCSASATGMPNAGDAIVRPDPAASSWWVSDSLVGSQARAARLGGRERLAVAGRLGDPARS
jgi:hypothetical protein